MGVTLVEQPLPAWNIAGLARVRARSAVPLMADECVFTPHDMLAVAQAAAADALSLKLVKHGGLLGLRKVAAVAEAAGVSLYGGCLLESSIGAAAHLQVFAGLRSLAWGCEHFGPHILTERPRDRAAAASRTSTSTCRPGPASASRSTRTSCAGTRAPEEDHDALPCPYGRAPAARHRPGPVRRAEGRGEGRAQDLQRAGKWPHLWRIAGQYSNISIFDVADHDELHAILSRCRCFRSCRST